MKTEMLSSLSRDVGVIVFANTSVSGEEARSYVNIFQALWQHAEAMKAARGNASATDPVPAIAQGGREPVLRALRRNASD